MEPQLSSSEPSPPHQIPASTLPQFTSGAPFICISAPDAAERLAPSLTTSGRSKVSVSLSAMLPSITIASAPASPLAALRSSKVETVTASPPASRISCTSPFTLPPSCKRPQSESRYTEAFSEAPSTVTSEPPAATTVPSSANSPAVHSTPPSRSISAPGMTRRAPSLISRGLSSSVTVPGSPTFAPEPSSITAATVLSARAKASSVSLLTVTASSNSSSCLKLASSCGCEVPASCCPGIRSASAAIKASAHSRAAIRPDTRRFAAGACASAALSPSREPASTPADASSVQYSPEYSSSTVWQRFSGFISIPLSRARCCSGVMSTPSAIGAASSSESSLSRDLGGTRPVRQKYIVAERA